MNLNDPVQIELLKFCNSVLRSFLSAEYSTRGQFLEHCAQLLRPAPNFLTALSGEEVEHQKMANFYRHLYFHSSKNPN